MSVSHRKDSIVKTSIEVMNEYGVQALSTKEVAKREGISEGAIFKHFPKKNDLIVATLEQYAEYDEVIFEAINQKSMDAKEAIVYFFDEFSSHYEEYPAITAIDQALDELRYNPELEERIKEVIDKRREYLLTLIEKGQRTGLIENDLDKADLVEIILGTFHGICLKWRISNYNFSLKEKTLRAIKMVLGIF